MLRVIIAVVVGFAIWSVAWLGGNAGVKAALPSAFSGGEIPSGVGVLLLVLVLSVACSLAAGIGAAGLSGRGRMAPALLLGIILLAVGIPIQLTVWDKMPAWYHLSFLALLIPATLLGARLIHRNARLS